MMERAATDLVLVNGPGQYGRLRCVYGARSVHMYSCIYGCMYCIYICIYIYICI